MSGSSSEDWVRSLAMKLYLTDASGNSYKVRVLCSILNVPYEKVYVDWPSREHKREPFIKLNPRGQVPVMEIEGKVFWDSTAHLVYIARKYGARAALFGRKIKDAEHPLTMVALLRRVADGEIEPEEAVRAYHGELQKLGVPAKRALAEDSQLTACELAYAK